jgi:hypothetical protein
LISELDAASAKIAEAEILKNRQLPPGTGFGKSFAEKLNEVINRNKGGK